MAVGDVDSNERGSGARFNEGKDRLELIPVRVWRKEWEPRIHACESKSNETARAANVVSCALIRMQGLQEGTPLDRFSYGDSLLTEASAVFDFGSQKYAAWNWAKGMAWSVVLGCVLRHSRAIIVHNELIDLDSGLRHTGHIACNLIMLDWFQEFYPEGNDIVLPQEALSHAA